MSEEELARDRELVLEEYRDAKAALGPVERKLQRFYAACREIGVNASAGCGNVSEPRLVGGKIEVGFARDRFFLSDLLNEAELLALLIELEAARKRLIKAAEAKHDLKIY